MAIHLSLKYSPSLVHVRDQVEEFSCTYGPADLYYYGVVVDEANQQFRFRDALNVARLMPFTGSMALRLPDLWLTWKVFPKKPYVFEVVLRGAKPSKAIHQLNIAELWPEWAPEIQPYAAANKAEKLDDILKLLGFQRPRLLDNQAALSKQFPAKRHCGVYVLHFANGQHYVGQTVHIVQRVRQHQKIHTDIQQVSFRPLGRKRLDFHEAELIRLLEHKGFVLRNIAMTSSLSQEPGDFDKVMCAERQSRWLSDVRYSDLDGPRIDKNASERNPVLTKRFEQLQSYAGYRDLVRVVRAYVRSALPAYKRSEAAYWQLSCLPPGYKVLARINVNWQEVFFVDQDAMGLYFYMCLSKRLLESAFGTELEGLTQRYPALEWDDVWYRAGGGDQGKIRDSGDSDTAYCLVTDPDIIPAMRHYNLRLMKRGLCPWSKSHNFDLADQLINDTTSEVA